MSIPEAAQLILQAGSLGVGGEIFLLDMGHPIKIIDIAKELIRLSGFEPYKDIKIKFTGTRPGEKKSEELSSESEKLDKTKHNKIFVLNSDYITKSNSHSLIKKIEDIKKLYKSMTRNQLISTISEILPEYNPKIISNENLIISSKKSKLKF